MHSLMEGFGFGFLSSRTDCPLDTSSRVYSYRKPFRGLKSASVPANAEVQNALIDLAKGLTPLLLHLLYHRPSHASVSIFSLSSLPETGGLGSLAVLCPEIWDCMFTLAGSVGEMTAATGCCCCWLD